MATWQWIRESELTYLQKIQKDELIYGKQSNLKYGHYHHLDWACLAQHSPKWDQHWASAEVCIDHAAGESYPVSGFNIYIWEIWMR